VSLLLSSKLFTVAWLASQKYNRLLVDKERGNTFCCINNLALSLLMWRANWSYISQSFTSQKPGLPGLCFLRTMGSVMHGINEECCECQTLLFSATTNTGWAKSRRALDCFFIFMAEILGGYWQLLDRSGKKIILLSPMTTLYCNKQTLALRQASEESACFLLSFFCYD